MATTAGHNADLYITTTDTAPAAADIVGQAQATGLNLTAAELDASYLGTSYTSFILGKSSAELPVSGDFDSADTGQSRIKAAFDSGATIWAHLASTGSSSCIKVPVKVPNFNLEVSQDGKLTFSTTLKSVGAVGTSTVS